MKPDLSPSLRLFGCPVMYCQSVQLKVPIKLSMHVSKDNSSIVQTKYDMIPSLSNYLLLTGLKRYPLFNTVNKYDF